LAKNANPMPHKNENSIKKNKIYRWWRCAGDQLHVPRPWTRPPFFLTVVEYHTHHQLRRREHEDFAEMSVQTHGANGSIRLARQNFLPMQNFPVRYSGQVKQYNALSGFPLYWKKKIQEFFSPILEFSR